MNSNLQENDLMAVVNALKYNINRDLKVATLGKVIKIQDTVSVIPFPLTENETEQSIYCYKLSSLNIVKNDIVLVIFCDRNFIQNLSQAKNNQPLTKLTSETTLHTVKYGVIIGKVE